MALLPFSMVGGWGKMFGPAMRCSSLRATVPPQGGPHPAASLAQKGAAPPSLVMIHALIRRLVRWFAYRPERRYMRGRG